MGLQGTWEKRSCLGLRLRRSSYGWGFGRCFGDGLGESLRNLGDEKRSKKPGWKGVG